ncbi:helix-turn-helix domain-containing protein [Rubrobacter marinus]|uniref:Helix-turn-helix domain-containing protein n=1 Tax=Rubrobacter marinus TaxID=2653852 RepID=A0A6G8PUC9_9ACTN|nr:helix-turn-helix domain-containing protein [Rubrobacter marinus]QIN77596.1 helix-turn-helix domain-containing protein [Rubrobacter marinus]
MSVEEVAGYLGVGRVTVYRWCREGRLPCLKVGRSWRIRQGTLEDFLRRGERPSTLVGQLGGFLEVPDNVLGVAQNRELLHRLDAAFLRVGEARGGLLVKFTGGETGTSDEELREDLEDHGLEVERLESEGRLRIVPEQIPATDRNEGLRRLMEEEASSGRAIWASFNWTQEVDLETALAQQEGMADLVGESQLVVKTAVLEEVSDAWSSREQRRAWGAHSGTIWLSDRGLALSRFVPLSPN